MTLALVEVEKNTRSAMESKFLGETGVIIVGGGQAGLSVGRYLKEFGHPFIILDKNDGIGVSWRNRYDSLVLDSFAKYSQLEDFPFNIDPMRQASKDEVVSYLQSFAKYYDITPHFYTEVLNIEKHNNEFIVKTNKGFYKAKFVVLATGPFQQPLIPKASEYISKEICQIHSNDYKNPSQLKPGSVLVVGRGNSGTEIVEELLESSREVLFSFKGKLKSVKSSFFSQWLAYRLGLAHIPKHTIFGKLILWYTKGKAVGVDIKKLLSSPKIKIIGEFLGVADGGIIFSKGKIRKIANIIWATGYESDFSIVSIPNFNPEIQKRGVTNIRGLFLLNIRWQYSKSSSHLAGVSRDAKYIARYIIDKSRK